MPKVILYHDERSCVDINTDDDGVEISQELLDSEKKAWEAYLAALSAVEQAYVEAGGDPDY